MTGLVCDPCGRPVGARGLVVVEAQEVEHGGLYVADVEVDAATRVCSWACLAQFARSMTQAREDET